MLGIPPLVHGANAFLYVFLVPMSSALKSALVPRSAPCSTVVSAIGTEDVIGANVIGLADAGAITFVDAGVSIGAEIVVVFAILQTVGFNSAI